MNYVEPIRSKDDIQAMKEYLLEWNQRNYMLFVFGINTGLRISDIIKLRVKDVAGWHIRLRERKTGKEKRIKITPVLKKELKVYVRGMKSYYYLFPSRKGKNKPLTRQAAYLIIKTAAEELGIDNVGTHTMRKTFGYHYYKKYMDVAMLMELFNHASPKITLKYIGISQDQIDITMTRFGL